MVDYSELQMREIISIVQMEFPDAPPALIMRLANDGLKKAGNKYRLQTKRKFIDVVNGISYYDISDEDILKIIGVAFMNSDGEHVRIQRLGPHTKLVEGE